MRALALTTIVPAPCIRSLRARACAESTTIHGVDCETGHEFPGQCPFHELFPVRSSAWGTFNTTIVRRKVHRLRPYLGSTNVVAVVLCRI